MSKHRIALTPEEKLEEAGEAFYKYARKAETAISDARKLVRGLEALIDLQKKAIDEKNAIIAAYAKVTTKTQKEAVQVRMTQYRAD